MRWGRGTEMDETKGICMQKDRIILSSDFFERTSILSTAAKFTYKYFIEIKEIEINKFEVIIQEKQKQIVDENISKEFYNELINEQVRIDMQKQFGKLREMIIEQAFYPLEKK
jgi:His-Xaa-Ser system protein HxsD